MCKGVLLEQIRHIDYTSETRCTGCLERILIPTTRDYCTNRRPWAQAKSPLRDFSEASDKMASSGSSSSNSTAVEAQPVVTMDSMLASFGLDYFMNVESGFTGRIKDR